MADQSTLPATRATTIAKKPNRNQRITKPIAEAIEYMVNEGLRFDAAALKANITVRAMRLALDKPHVIRHLKQRREVFRESICAGNIFKLAEIRDQDSNQMAALGAIKQLEQIGESADVAGATKRAPGLVFIINNNAQQIEQQPPNNANALTINGTVTNDD